MLNEPQLQKMVRREAFPLKPKHQCHLSQWVEWAYGAQSWNEMRLLCESMFVSIDGQTLILKNSWKKSLFYEANASMSFILMSQMSLWCPIMKKNRLLCESVFVLIDRWTLTLKNGGKKNFTYETKALMSFIAMRRMSL